MSFSCQFYCMSNFLILLTMTCNFVTIKSEDSNLHIRDRFICTGYIPKMRKMITLLLFMAWLMLVDSFVMMQSFSHGTTSNLVLVLFKQYIFVWNVLPLLFFSPLLWAAKNPLVGELFDYHYAFNYSISLVLNGIDILVILSPDMRNCNIEYF